MKKIEKIHERALQILHIDFDSDCLTLLNKHNKATMKVKRLRNLASEVFNTINNLNPEYMKESASKQNNTTNMVSKISAI